MARDRLDFYFSGEPVGFFVDADYPTIPGRFEYVPYRGQGHYLFKEALRRGSVECSVMRDGRAFSVVIISEELDQEHPERPWFMQVSRSGETPR